MKVIFLTSFSLHAKNIPCVSPVKKIFFPPVCRLFVACQISAVCRKISLRFLCVFPLWFLCVLGKCHRFVTAIFKKFSLFARCSLSWFGLGSLKNITAFSRLHIVARSSPKLKKSSLNRRLNIKISLVYHWFLTRFSVAVRLRFSVVFLLFFLCSSFATPKI